MIVKQDGIPYLLEKGEYFPLIINMDRIINCIKQGYMDESEEVRKELNEEYSMIMGFIKDPDNHMRQDFDKLATIGLFGWIEDNVDYIDDDYINSLIPMLTADNLYGIVYNDIIMDEVSIDVYIFDDTSPSIHADNYSDDIGTEMREFRFYEEDFWTVTEPIFNSLMVWFGGWNLKRKTMDEFSKRYIAAETLVDTMSIVNPNKKKKYISGSNCEYKSVSIPKGVQQTMGMFDSINCTETTMLEGGILDTEKIQLFKYFEDKNLANIFSFATYQKFRSCYDGHGYKFEDVNLPIEWEFDCDFHEDMFKTEVP